MYLDREDYEKALPLFERCLKIRHEFYGAYHDRVYLTLNRLAVVYSELKHYDQAESMLKRAVESKQHKPGGITSSIAHNLCWLAELYEKQGRYTDAVEQYQKALEKYEWALGQGHGKIDEVKIDLARVQALLETG